MGEKKKPSTRSWDGLTEDGELEALSISSGESSSSSGRVGIVWAVGGRERVRGKKKGVWDSDTARWKGLVEDGLAGGPAVPHSAEISFCKTSHHRYTNRTLNRNSARKGHDVFMRPILAAFAFFPYPQDPSPCIYQRSLRGSGFSCKPNTDLRYILTDSTVHEVMYL